MKPLPLAIILLLLAGPLMASTIYVDASNTTGPWNGTADQPYQYIQDGINAAMEGDTVLVRDGTYTGPGNRDLNFHGKAITVRSEDGPAATIINCQGTEAEPHRGFWFGPYDVEGQVLDGFAICNGHADFGGGIFCDQYSKPTIKNCVITNNAAAGGGGIYCEYDSSPTITRCTITGNTADGEGGGVDCWFSDATIVNCVIAGNTAEWGGGLCLGGSGSVTIVNCTIAQNAADHAGGIFCYFSEPTVTNCIVWGNSPQGIIADSATPSVTFCDVEGGWPGQRNINADPRFADPASGVFHIQGDSPCFDMGRSEGAPDTDIEGTARPWGWGYDIGAYEFVGTDTDGDGLPDEWERRYFGHTDYGADDDPDGDGLTNWDEGAAHANPDDADTDGDGLTDGDEVNLHGTDPLDTDTDQDGLPDGWEVSNDLNPNNSADAWGDADGDLLLNTEEYVFGSDPQDSESPAFIYVDDDNAGDPAQDGTCEHPYESIGDAIQAATPPAVVKVLPGTYSESVTMTSGVWLIGSGARVTTISGRVRFSQVCDGLLAGFTTGHSTYRAILAAYSTETVRDCVCTSSTMGIEVGGTGSARIVNCLIVGNRENGVEQRASADLELINCTIIGNGVSGVKRWWDAGGEITITNSILWDNENDLHGAKAEFTVLYSNIGDGDFAGFDGNISADPLFVKGPQHDYYLSQVESGQELNSPCLDAGGDPAAHLGMHRLTTRTDGVPDMGIVDIGYHAQYAVWIDWIFRCGDIVIIHWNARSGKSYVVEWSADRETWHEIDVGHVPLWADGDTELYSRKFYRVREQ